MRLGNSILSFLLLLASAGPVAAAPIWERVADGPAADVIRESLRSLERGDEATDRREQLRWYEQGQALAEKAVAVAPDDTDAHFALFANRGRIIVIEGIVWNVGEIPGLRRHLDRALELDPENPNALAARGGLYFRLPGWLGGDSDKAEPLLLRAAKLDPSAAGTRLELADLYVETDREADAVAFAREALRLARAENRAHHERRALDLLADLGVGEGPAPRDPATTDLAAR